MKFRTSLVLAAAMVCASLASGCRNGPLAGWGGCAGGNCGSACSTCAPNTSGGYMPNQAMQSGNVTYGGQAPMQQAPMQQTPIQQAPIQ